jgi:hypothetical protein
MMPRGNGIKTENYATLVQTIELQVAVAFNTRVGRNADGMIVDIWLNHIAMKIFGEVKDQVIDPELLSNSTGIVNIAHAATTGIAVATPEAHGHANNFMTLFEQQCSGNRRINATRHRNENLHGLQATAILYCSDSSDRVGDCLNRPINVIFARGVAQTQA